MSPDDPLILVIDDEPQLLRFLSAALKSHDYRVMTAATAEEGRSAAKAAGTEKPRLTARTRTTWLLMSFCLARAGQTHLDANQRTNGAGRAQPPR